MLNNPTDSTQSELFPQSYFSSLALQHLACCLQILSATADGKDASMSSSNTSPMPRWSLTTPFLSHPLASLQREKKLKCRVAEASSINLFGPPELIVFK